MIDQLRAAFEAAKRDLHARSTALDEVHKRITEADDGDVAGIQSEFDQVVEAFDEAKAELDRCKRNLTAAEERVRLLDENPVEEPSRSPTVARGATQEEFYYRPDKRERSFFRDAFLAEFRMDGRAQERINKHTEHHLDVYDQRGIQMLEPERRDVGTGAFTGIVVPQYLIDQFTPLRRAGAPLLPYYRTLDLPENGMTVNIGRLTTGTGVAAQASENAAVQETDADDTLLTVNVRTYSGQQDLSRQAVERGQGLVDAVIYEDLTRAYFTTVDSATINADGTTGTHLGIRSTAGIVAVTYTDATPTVGELYAKLADAIQQINAGIFAPATLIVMHPRRWGFFTAALDTTNRPLVLPNTNGPFNAVGVGESAGYGGPVGTLHGLPVITDGNIPTNLGAGTNEDVILILGTSEHFYWQEGGDGMPRRFQFEQVAPPQSVRLAVWSYSAFTAGRYPLASATIGGTGFTPPTF